MANVTYYDILQVSENASTEVIHMAYKALAKKYHPDANMDDPSATQRFQRLQRAYETLSDPVRRLEYDKYLAQQKAEQAEQSHSSTAPNLQTKAAPVSETQTDKPYTYPSIRRSITVICVFLLLLFSQTIHPYIESEVYYNDAPILGLFWLATACLFMLPLPMFIGTFLSDCSPKRIKLFCAIYSASIFVISFLLMICGITDQMLFGWLDLILFYFINKHILFLSHNQSTTKRIIAAIILSICLAATLHWGYEFVNSNSIGCNHDWSPATCTTPKVCTLCGEEEGEPLGHTTQNDICDRCGKMAHVSAGTIGVRVITLEGEFMAYYLYGMWEKVGTEEFMIGIIEKNAPEQDSDIIYIEQGDFVDEVDSWCFDPARKVGDAAVIENDYGFTICYISVIGSN